MLKGKKLNVCAIIFCVMGIISIMYRYPISITSSTSCASLMVIGLMHGYIIICKKNNVSKEL